MNFAKAIKLFLSAAGLIPFNAILKALKSLKRKAPPEVTAGLEILSKLTPEEVKDLASETEALATKVKDSHADGKLSPAEALELAESAIRLASHVSAATK